MNKPQAPHQPTAGRPPFAFGLIDTHQWTVQAVAQVVLPSGTAALTMAEFARELRSLLGRSHTGSAGEADEPLPLWRATGWV